jgi:cytochrome c oxidase cbb3-type subunit 2
LINPRDVVPESNMPGFPWLLENKLTGELTAKKMEVFRNFGVPYTDDDIKNGPASVKGKTEMEALIAYLQQLGTVMKQRR